jgi:ketosteroid isomerase-like protein
VSVLRLLVCAAIVASPACRPAASGHPADDPAAPPLTGADIAAIRGVDSAFAGAAGAGDASGMAAAYLADAHLLPPHAPAVQGRAGIERFWAGLLAGYRVKLDLVADEIEGRGDLAYARGRFTLEATPRAAGTPPLGDEGKYLEVLHRQSDGTWRYLADMYNSDLPLASARPADRADSAASRAAPAPGIQ